MGGILNLIFSKKIETYVPIFFLGASSYKCKEVTGKRWLPERLWGGPDICFPLPGRGSLT
jgi:hypothetical protein